MLYLFAISIPYNSAKLEQNIRFCNSFYINYSRNAIFHKNFSLYFYVHIIYLM